MADEQKPLQERRKFARVDKKFVVSYRIYGDTKGRTDISQTKNISFGGILMTTDIPFASGTVLSLKLRLPIMNETIDVLGRVTASSRYVNELIYDTHIEFIDVTEKNRVSLQKTMDLFLKKDEKK